MAISFAQYALTAPGDILPGVVQIITNTSIFIPMLGFEETTEFVKSYDRQTTLGGIAFRGLNQYYASDVGIINPASEPLRVFGGTIDTDRQLAKGPKGTANRANKIAAKTKKAALFFDKYVVDGDSGVSPLQFDGLNVRLIGNQLKTAAVNGATLTLAMIDALQNAVVGPNSQKKLIMNKDCRTKVKNLILASAGGAGVGDFNSGELESYASSKILTLDEDGDEQPILAYDESVGTSNVTTSIYCVNPGSMDGEYFRGLVRKLDGSEPIEHVDYGERSGVYQDLVESVMGIALYHPRCAARLRGIISG